MPTRLDEFDACLLTLFSLPIRLPLPLRISLVTTMNLWMGITMNLVPAQCCPGY